MESYNKTFKEYHWKNDKEFDLINWNEEIKKIESEGFEVIACEPIEQIIVKIVGRKFTLRKK